MGLIVRPPWAKSKGKTTPAANVGELDLHHNCDDLPSLPVFARSNRMKKLLSPYSAAPVITYPPFRSRPLFLAIWRCG
jgi:hypothetical protein